MRRVLVTLLCCLSLPLLAAGGTDIILDYCVADTAAAQHLHLNVLPCISPTLARSYHFATSALARPGNTSSALFGFSVTITDPAATLPGANAQGVAMARTDIAPGGVVPPHVHPRASEAAILLQGNVLVGFVDTAYRLFTQQLRPGDAFIFPKGLSHFLYSMDPRTPALVLSGFSSQSPGTQLAPLAAFEAAPGLPVEVLKRAYNISGLEVHRIQINLGG